MKLTNTAEYKRLIASAERKADWKNWGPYVSDRAWGTVREDYSTHGEAWEYFPHDHARSRTFRWSEDGIAGVCNRFQNICLAVAFWNEHDPILKERFFGLTGNEGNHGEDVKEQYFYLDSTPTHSYMKMLYKYPQVAYPYEQLVSGNRQRGRFDPEYELIDILGAAFATGRYFDIFIEYAKAGEQDILCRITAYNRGPEAAPLHILPHLWFRNTWSWGYGRPRPELRALDDHTVYTNHRHLGERWWVVDPAGFDRIPFLFTHNETNHERIFNSPNPGPYVKDGIERAVIHGEAGKVNPDQTGTKVAAHFQAQVPAGERMVVRLRFTNARPEEPFTEFDKIFGKRIKEADQFYAAVAEENISDELRQIQRQALAGLMWSKQYYHYGVQLWLDGDPAQPPPPPQRKLGRNNHWRHLYNTDVISMPDKWEYPWYAAWDLAFHMLPVAMIDPEWAKRQLIVLLREWYMHPNGQIPAYEWAFGDVNPPVHAWAAFRVYKIARNITGWADIPFLERIFHKLLLNFTWWVNRKDVEGKNVFEGGFLGLDNIGVFDRSAPLPSGGHLEQADSTAWMAMYCLNMMAIALELARSRPAYEDVATKFFEHFIYIANAINGEDKNHGLWDEVDGFYYDHIHTANGERLIVRLCSFVGLIPLFAVETLEPDLLEMLPRFKRRMDWFIEHRPWLVNHIASLTEPGEEGRYLLSLVDRERLPRILGRIFDETEFLSPYGLRSISKKHEGQPYSTRIGGQEFTVRYEPAESTSGLFGGNSNWRGPVWFPLNFLMVESLQKFGHYYGDSFKIEVPGGSGREANLDEAAHMLSHRLIALFTRDEETGRRPFYGGVDLFQEDPHWRDYMLYYEYFHGDNGAGLGAAHQTGWTALVAKLIQRSGANY